MTHPRHAADAAHHGRGHRQGGVVLAMVLVLALVLSASVVTFLRRAVVDTVVIRNRDQVAQAEALARGGVQLATALLLEDLLLKAEAAREGGGGGDTLDDLWARAKDLELTTPEGGSLKLRIEDSGARLNLNAFIDHTLAENDLGGPENDQAEEFLTQFLTKTIDEIDLPPGEKNYDAREIARNLLDYIDPDDQRAHGGPEDDYYQRQDPPYRAANRPLLSVDELRRVQGFDEVLWEAVSPYVTVYPFGGKTGINLNTAPPHVLATVYHGQESGGRLADEDLVRAILKVREQGNILCADTASDPLRCIALNEIRLDGDSYPPSPLSNARQASVFTVVSEATVGEIRRRVTAVIDRTVPDDPRLLSWKLR